MKTGAFLLAILENKIMQNVESQDKRTFERIPVKLPLRFLDVYSSKEGQAQAQDISAKGIGFLTNVELSSHTPLEMWLDIPQRNTPLYIRGKVAWSTSVQPQQYRIGVNLERADLMGISSVLRTNRFK